MWQRFTERARKIIFFAQEEAQKLGEGYVSTEHLLLGLVREADSMAARVLDHLGISLTRLQEEVRRQLPRGESRTTQEMQLTPRAKRVIDLAYDEARQLNNNYIGTEHLLLGLIREGEGLAGRVLEKLGVDLERARRETIAIQDNEPKQEPAPGLPTPRPAPAREVPAARSYTRPRSRELVADFAKAIELYSDVWEMLHSSERTEEVSLKMLTMAHASLYHWGRGDSPVGVVRGKWQVSRVYSALGWAMPALLYAKQSLEACGKHGIGDFDMAFALEAVARAYAVSGDAKQRNKYVAMADEAAASITSDEDREFFLKELATVPEVDAS